MEKYFLLHMITPEKNVSPFDANMAYDAGWESIIPYTSVEMDEVKTLVQTHGNFFWWQRLSYGNGNA